MGQPVVTQDAPRILVIGSGSAGLLTAQALQMQGCKVTVFEQDSSINARPRDWNFGIYWAQVPLKECLPEHLQNEVENAQVDDHRAGEDEVMPIYNGESGELLKAVPIPFNIRLARRRFLKLVSQGIDIQYGKRLTDVHSDGKQATAHFEDGTTETGDLVIGAEGAHSPIRKFLVGPEKAEPTYLPMVASVCMATLPREAALKFRQYARRLMVIFHPLGYFNWVGLHEAPAGSEPGDWNFMMIMSWIPSDSENHDVTNLQGEKILADLKRRANDFSPPPTCQPIQFRLDRRDIATTRRVEHGNTVDTTFQSLAGLRLIHEPLGRTRERHLVDITISATARINPTAGH